MNRAQTPIVIFSHLRWNSVFQRPHHLVSRLARRRRVVFIEEPENDPQGDGTWDADQPLPGVFVARPKTRVPAPGFHPLQVPALTSMTEQLLQRLRIHNPILWLYTPLALPIAAAIEPSVVVYDCMDQLSAFLGAAPEMELREAALLKRADVIFTGGPSLYRAKKKFSPYVRCFPSSVDAAHFRSAGAEPPDQAGLPHPRLGFYGVIDERLDPAIVDAVAAAHPEWQILMIGPIVKIDPATLPRRPNIHYLGERPYEALPEHLAGWDACLMPFARNEATRFISPTKTLEYMAAEKPIVSTLIRDVVEPYGDIVYSGGTPAEFVAACEAALSAPAEEREHRAMRMREVIAATSWDATVAAMEQELLLAEHRSRRSETAGAKDGDLLAEGTDRP